MWNGDIYNSVYLAIDYSCIFEFIQEQMLVDIFLFNLTDVLKLPLEIWIYMERHVIIKN